MSKILSSIILIVAIAIAACAAYFSITGLMVLFSAEAMAVAIIAAILELGKLTGTYALHHYWKELPVYIKAPLVSMVAILMFITSLGILGFLSKAHIEKGTPLIQVESQIRIIEQSIQVHDTNIKMYTEKMDQLNQSIARLTSMDKITKGLQVREQYSNELTTLQDGIKKESEAIAELEKSKIELKSKVSEVEAKLGPIKFVAELFGIDTSTEKGNRDTVLVMIVLLMIAFDPLAIVLIMLFDWVNTREKKESVIVEEPVVEPVVKKKRPYNRKPKKEALTTPEESVINESEERIVDEIVRTIEENPSLIEDEELVDTILHSDQVDEKIKTTVAKRKTSWLHNKRVT